MHNPLAADALMRHVVALADEIGPRPSGHPAEAQARAYIRQVLHDLGITAIEEQPFRTGDWVQRAFLLPQAAALLSKALAALGRRGTALGGLATLAIAAHLRRFFSGGRQFFPRLSANHQSANLIVRLPAAAEKRHTVVLIGHTDTQMYSPFFEPAFKRLILPATTGALLTMAGSGLIDLIHGLRPRRWTRLLKRISLAGSFLNLAMLVGIQRRAAYVPGANDNASAVACLLGLAAQLQATPLAHTEVWLAFTGAEEVMCVGMHQLLDAYGDWLEDAWFIDIEMVGSQRVVYVTEHSGLSYLNRYTPDTESLALAAQTAKQHPELGIAGAPMMIVEEVGTLRQRGYRGLCLAGVGPDGWLENWHLPSDTSANLHPAGLEKAARFALAMLHQLDAR